MSENILIDETNAERFYIGETIKQFYVAVSLN